MQEVENKADYDQWCQAFAEVWDRDLEETLIFFQGFMEAPDLHPYLAYVDNKIVGGCCLDLSEGNAGFYWDYVLPKYRRKGYGSAMIKWRLNYAKQQGVKMGYVQCLQSSIGIYKDCGFESTQPMSLFKRVV
jgi:GNAT superfamily N-acetyltransferase